MKRIFIIIAGVIVIIGLFVGAYFLFFAPDSATLTVGNPFDDIGSGNAAPNSDLPTDGTFQNAGTTLGERFVKITDGPVARGEAVFNVMVEDENELSNETPPVSFSSASSTASTTVTTAATKPDVEVHFIDRASGNVYSYLAHSRTLTRISNKTLPGIQTASWTPDGSHAYVQFLTTDGTEEQVSTYALTADGGEGRLLENDLEQAEVASTTLFTLLSGSTGSVGTVSALDGSDSRTLFSSLLSSLVVHPTTGTFYGTNKPSSQLDGYAFSINRSTGSFSRILGPFRGLSVLPSLGGRSLIYSYTDGGAYRLRVLDTDTRTSTALPLATLTEKCVWTHDSLSVYCAVPTNLQGNLPDDWYQGAIVFADRIWKIDLTERVATLVLDPSQVGKVSVDAVGLALDPAEDVLVFMDKHSGALYAYDL